MNFNVHCFCMKMYQKYRHPYEFHCCISTCEIPMTIETKGKQTTYLLWITQDESIQISSHSFLSVIFAFAGKSIKYIGENHWTCWNEFHVSNFFIYFYIFFFHRIFFSCLCALENKKMKKDTFFTIYLPLLFYLIFFSLSLVPFHSILLQRSGEKI